MKTSNKNALVDSTDVHQFPLPDGVDRIDWIAQSKYTFEQLDGLIRHTDMVDSQALSSSGSVVIKNETLHKGNTFKTRNATSAALHYVKRGERDFITGSAGSFGIGLADFFSHFKKDDAPEGVNFELEVVVPDCTHKPKIELLHSLGALVTIHGNTVDEALKYASAKATSNNLRFVHPFANVYSILGASTIAWELLQDEPDMTHLVLPYGGGSMAAGVGTIVKKLKPEVEIAVAQVERNSAFNDSVVSGETKQSNTPDTRFGGIAVRATHPLNLGLASLVVDRVLTLSAGYLYETLDTLKDQDELGKVLEEAGACSPAGARYLAEKESLVGARIVAIATGANPGPVTAVYSAAVARRRADSKG